MLRRAGARMAVIALVLGLSLPACGGGSPVRGDADDLSHVRGFLESVFARVATDRLSETRASRVYANVTLAMLVVQSRVDPGAAALLRRVEGIPRTKAPATLDTGIATVAAAATTARSLFATTFDRTAFARARDVSISEMTKGVDARTVAASVAYGVRVGSAVAARASRDGASAAGSPGLVPAPGPGQWVPTPPSFAAAVDPGWGKVRHFVKGTANCVLDEPARGEVPKSPWEERAAAVRSVSLELTELQKAAARFWDDGSGPTIRPAGHWLRIALAVAAKKQRSLAQTVTIASAVSMTMADAYVQTWRAKYEWMVERPVTVIQRTDPAWRPYLETPAHPEYVSAHASVARAAADVLTEYLGETPFGDPGWGVAAGARGEAGIKKQLFESFRAAANQSSLSRLYAGTDYRESLWAGTRLGGCVALKVTTGLAT